MTKCQNGACKNCHNGTDKCYLYTTQDWKEFRTRHPEHLGEAGGYCLMCAAVNALKEERNAVLDEVKREVEKEYGDEHPRAQSITRKDISTIINNLRVK